VGAVTYPGGRNARKKKQIQAGLQSQGGLGALKADKSIVELAQIYQVHPNQITAWKKQLLEAASSVFEGKHAKVEASVDLDALYQKIGRLEMERDFLASRPGVVAQLKKEAT